MSVQLTTLSSVKLWLGIATAETSGDALLTQLINESSDWIDHYVQEDIVAVNVTEKYHGSGKDTLYVKRAPIISVASLKISGALIDPSLYYFDSYKIELTSSYFTEGKRNIEITYQVGYSPIPDAIIQATNELIAESYKYRARIGQQSVNTGGGQTASARIERIPVRITEILEIFQRPYIPNDYGLLNG